MILKLGTRKSLLAHAQSIWVARQLECYNAGLQVTLVEVEARSNRPPSVNSQLLDEALLSGRVDFIVNSMKDLYFERPREIKLGAIPRREDPRDVALFAPDVLERMRRGLPLRIGGSSPRRLETVPKFLEAALPRVGPPTRLSWTDVRGGVDERLAHLHRTEHDTGRLDALVLAFAALIRLWRDDHAHELLRPLLLNLRWMVLPLHECPGAPGQGALALECRSSDDVTLHRLKKIHDPLSARLVSMEREVLHQWNEASPQRFGAAAICTEATGDVLFLRGVRPDGAPLCEMWSQAPRSYRLPEAGPDGIRLSPTRLWACDVNRWLKLASDGLWVEGCADGLGFDATHSTRAEPVLELSQTKDCNGL